MKRIENLDDKLRALTKRDIDMNLVPSLRDVLAESVGRMEATTTKDVKLYGKLAEMILDAKGSIDLDETSHQIIKDCLERNPSRYFPWYMSQVLEILK